MGQFVDYNNLKLHWLDVKLWILNQGYLTSFTEIDPTVPSWAKATTKPSYTAAEVGALPNTTTIPTKTSQLTNDSNFLTSHLDISGKQDSSTLEVDVKKFINATYIASLIEDATNTKY